MLMTNYIIFGLGAIFLQTPGIAKNANVDFCYATGRRLEIIQGVVIKITAQAAHLFRIQFQ